MASHKLAEDRDRQTGGEVESTVVPNPNDCHLVIFATSRLDGEMTTAHRDHLHHADSKIEMSIAFATEALLHSTNTVGLGRLHMAGREVDSEVRVHENLMMKPLSRCLGGTQEMLLMCRS